mmetsp:Transcript_52423/g.162743  ORF Transcript_52423/g.162743 Transcript_52423/m.162743 type:complete len:208 (+) Transcript_52423:335-958(+)
MPSLAPHILPSLLDKARKHREHGHEDHARGGDAGDGPHDCALPETRPPQKRCRVHSLRGGDDEVRAPAEPSERGGNGCRLQDERKPDALLPHGIADGPRRRKREQHATDNPRAEGYRQRLADRVHHDPNRARVQDRKEGDGQEQSPGDAGVVLGPPRLAGRADGAAVPQPWGSVEAAEGLAAVGHEAAEHRRRRSDPEARLFPLGQR